jgi:antitoxin component YwqK of YwqJK toxin-antitoxin module
MKLKSTILLIFAIISSASAQEWTNQKGLINNTKITTYWSADSSVIRSTGYYNNLSFGSVGQRIGTWKYFDEKGNIEEVSTYYMNKKHGINLHFYSNGRQKFEAYYFLGVLDSTFKAYYENGNIAETGNYSGIPEAFFNDSANSLDWTKKVDAFSSNKIGEWKYYYEDGREYQTSIFKNNDSIEYIKSFFNKESVQTIKKGEGFIKEYYQSGKAKSEIYYKSGLKDGKYILWNANGSIRVTGEYTLGEKSSEWRERYFVTDQDYQIYNYQKGNKHGEFKEFLPDGTKVITGTYNTGKKTDIWTYYFEGEKLDMQGPFVNDIQNGTWKYWYPNGQLYYFGNYNNGNKTGKWSFYYNNGILWREGNYANNKKHGEWLTYYENEQLAFEGSFNKGQENGEWISYYSNGQIKDQGYYENALMTKLWKGWYPNGEKKYEGSYSKDLKIGLWKYWTDKGVLKDEGKYSIVKDAENKGINKRSLSHSYKNGIWLSYSTSDSKIVSKGSYKDGKKDGLWQYYYPGGEIVSREINYKQGILSGVSKDFSRRGSIKSEISYKNNKKHGPLKVYSKNGKLVLHVIYKEGVKAKDVLKKKTFQYSK